MLNTDGRFRHVSATDPLLAGLQRLEEREQSGPSTDAFRAHLTVTVRDLRTERRRWPELARAARSAGMVAVAAVPVAAPGRAFGALSVWSRSALDWPVGHLAALGILADLASGQLGARIDLESLSETSRQLQHALDARVLVEQAKGVVAAQRGVTVERALDLLRSHARNRGQALKAVADEVIAGRLRL